jgi:5'-nucleotidase/UDP-sugar diphosphatase
MKRFFYKTLPILLICTLFFMGEFSIFCTAENHGSVTILFTHDIHDHFYPMNVLEGDKIISVGGFSRLYSAIKAEREKDPEPYWHGPK